MDNNEYGMIDPLEAMTSGLGRDYHEPEPPTWAVSEGEVSDVAYLAWDTSGSFDPGYIVEESSKDSTAVDPVGTAAAWEALEALSHFGLVRNQYEGMEPGYDLAERGLTSYEAGDSQELMKRRSDYGRLNFSGSNISDPEEAFQMIGKMHQKYNWDENERSEPESSRKSREELAELKEDILDDKTKF